MTTWVNAGDQIEERIMLTHPDAHDANVQIIRVAEHRYLLRLTGDQFQISLKTDTLSLANLADSLCVITADDLRRRAEEAKSCAPSNNRR